ncbi:MAG: thermonuclease family protein [Burkholderiaceae bacterium]
MTQIPAGARTRLLIIAVLISCAACVGRDVADNAPVDSTAGGSPGATRAGSEFEIQVQRLADGDSFTAVDRNGRQLKVRLAAIDSPERQQAGGREATDFLEQLSRGRWLRLQVRKVDRYGRLVGKILINGEDAGLAMVEAGLAWHFKRYEGEQPRAERLAFRAAQERARNAGKGIWHHPNPRPPWEWRREQQSKRELKSGEKAN